MPTVYRSKIHFWLMPVLGVTIIASVMACVQNEVVISPHGREAFIEDIEKRLQQAKDE